jgi:beta-glucosidase/6-phospho-beta-glucosidase/beta-galactosidase
MSLGINDLIISNKNNETMCAGFKINNLLLNSNNPAFVTLNNTKQINNKVSSIFNDLAVPTGLLYIQEKMQPIIKEDSVDVIGESLYNKLLTLAETKPKNKSKKRLRMNLKKGTKQRTSKIKRK